MWARSCGGNSLFFDLVANAAIIYLCTFVCLSVKPTCKSEMSSIHWHTPYKFKYANCHWKKLPFSSFDFGQSIFNVHLYWYVSLSLSKILFEIEIKSNQIKSKIRSISREMMKEKWKYENPIELYSKCSMDGILKLHNTTHTANTLAIEKFNVMILRRKIYQNSFVWVNKRKGTFMADSDTS